MLRLQRRDDGAIAVMAAVLIIVLMAVGALAVDLGNAWARKRSIQSSADLAALAGAQGLPDISAARTAAKNYINRNVIQGQGLGALSGSWDDNEASATSADELAAVGRADGEIDFYIDANVDGRPQASEQVTSGEADMIRVVPPPATVPFGLGRVLGRSSTTVQLPATARIGTALGLGMPPFFATSADTGAVCIMDSPNGSLSALPSALLLNGHRQIAITSLNPSSGPAGTTVVISGTDLPNTQPTVTFGQVAAQVVSFSASTVTVIAPAQATLSQVNVVVSKPGWTASNALPFAYTATPTATATATATATPTPTPTGIVLAGISPNPAAAGATVVLNGSNFPNGSVQVLFGAVVATIITSSDTSLTVTVPPSSLTTVDVTVRKNADVSNPVSFTYSAGVGAGTDPCAATSSNRGYLDEPRFGTGSSQAIERNIKNGIDHNVHDYRLWPVAGAPRTVTGTPECGTTTPPWYKSGGSTPLQDINCVNWQSGTAAGPLETGFFDNTASDLGRMYRLCNATTTTSGNKTGIDGNVLFSNTFVDTSKGSVADFRAAVLSGAVPTTSQKGWLKADILKCPRFAVLPVVNPADPPPNGSTYYPVLGFKAVYIDDETADRGFIWQGGSLKGVRGYVIDSGYLPATVSSQFAGQVGPYTGPGLPAVPLLTSDPTDRPS